MIKNLYLCLDQGGGSSRALVFDSTGRFIAQQQRAVAEFRTPQPAAADWVEQDPLQLIATLRESAEAVVAELSEEQRGQLQSCGLITQRSSMVCFRKDTGEAISPVLSWQDTRASDLLPGDTETIEKLYQRTGLMPNGHFAASKMRWCLTHLPAVELAAQQQQLCLAPLACYLSYHLLEESPCVVDRANASRTLLLDVERGEWDSDLIDLFSLQRAYLPKLIDCDDYIGDLQLDGWRLPMRLLTGDQCASAFALGQPDHQAVTINIGTGAFLLTPIKNPSVRNGQLNSIVHWRQGGCYMLEGTINAAGVAIHQMAKQLDISEPIERLQQLLDVDDELSPPLWINTVSGLGSPDWRTDIRSVFVDADDSSDDLRLMAVFESIVFLIMRNLMLMREFKPEIKNIRLSGGLAKIDGLCQRLSNVSGLVVLRCDNVEASSKGAAFLLSDQTGQWLDVKSEVFYPEEDKALQQRYRRWRDQLECRLEV